MEEQLLTHLSFKIQEEMKRFEEDTIAGHAKDYAGYQNACGIYRGLAIANGMIVELVTSLRKGDNDED